MLTRCLRKNSKLWESRGSRCTQRTAIGLSSGVLDESDWCDDMPQLAMSNVIVQEQCSRVPEWPQQMQWREGSLLLSCI